MGDYIQSYLQMISEQREWSWALIAFIYFVVVIIIRGYILKPLILKAKALDRKNYHEIKTNYLNQCGMGWLMLFASTSIVAFLWFRGITLSPSMRELAVLAAAVLLAIFSIMSHLIAFCSANLSAVKKAEESQKIL